MNKILTGIGSFLTSILIYLAAFIITLLFIAVVETLIKAFSTHVN